MIANALEIVGGALALILWLGIARMLAGHVAHRIASCYPSQHGVPDGFDWLAGLVCGLAWPLWLLLVGVARAARAGFGGVPKVGAEARHHARLRAKRIAELERKLELDPDA